MGVLDIFKKRKQKEEAQKEKISSEKSVEKQAKVFTPVKDEKSSSAKAAEDKPVEEKKKKAEKVSRKEDTSDAYKVLVRPLVTEKAADLGAYGKYVFEVSKGASKIQVKQAIKNVYGVLPVKVNIVSMGGKRRRFGRTTGHTRNWRKAVITLKPGEKIEIYEGV